MRSRGASLTRASRSNLYKPECRLNGGAPVFLWLQERGLALSRVLVSCQPTVTAPPSTRMKTLRISLLALASLSFAARADEVEDKINAALNFYKEGKLAEAGTGLQEALNAVNEKRGGSLAVVLPDAIGDWKAGKMESASLAALGGGNSVERQYKKGEKKATVSIAANSPLLSQVAGFLSNPALGGLLGLKTKSIGDLTAVIHAKEGLLQMVVNNSYLVQIQGKKLSEEELTTLASGVKVDLLKTIK